MPTSASEASVILNITKDYLKPKQMVELFTLLDNEVGKKTDNDSLKVSLSMMKALAESVPVEPKVPRYWWIAFYTVVIAHLALISFVALSFCILPFLEPWYVALPLNVFIFTVTFSREECKLTRLENYIRGKVGLKKIGGFVGFYVVKPTKNLFGLDI